jgi:hypothetical protein
MDWANEGSSVIIGVIVAALLVPSVISFFRSIAAAREEAIEATAEREQRKTILDMYEEGQKAARSDLERFATETEESLARASEVAGENAEKPSLPDDEVDPVGAAGAAVRIAATRPPVSTPPASATVTPETEAPPPSEFTAFQMGQLSTKFDHLTRRLELLEKRPLEEPGKKGVPASFWQALMGTIGVLGAAAIALVGVIVK